MNIEVKRLNTKRVLYDENSCRYTDEKFIITVKGDNVLIECSGDKGEFYALSFLSRKKPGDGEHVFSPAFRTRGYIEGFYGKPWSISSRLSVMSLLASHGMNAYFYAPKDDPYHRKLWKTLYPEKELSHLKTLVKEAKKNFMDFVWCIAPGLDVEYSSEKDFTLLLKKTEQLYKAGIRSFGLLLDDIEEDLIYPEDMEIYGETVNAHIDFVNRLYFELKKLDDKIKLTVCPSVYHGKGDEYYISKLGSSIPSDVSLFWTGRDVCSREITSREAMTFFENTRHKPLYWDNYPVNDMAMHFEMHLGPLIGRDKELYKYSEGIISNCMEYAECSKLPLITSADYMWEGEAYLPESSWESAAFELFGKEEGELFLTFADNLRISCLMDENSKRLKKLFFGKPDGDEIKAYIEKMYCAARFLKSDLPVCRELKKWAAKYSIACDIISLISSFSDSPDEEKKKRILRLIKKYNSLPEKLIEDSDFFEVMSYL